LAYGVQLAQRLIRLAVALVDLDGPVVVDVVVELVRDVAHVARTAAAAEGRRLERVDAGPHLDARAVARVGHRVIVDVDVLDNVVLRRVLAQRPDRDAVAAVALQPLHHHVGAVRLERHAVVAVVDDRVLDHDAVGPVCVPAVRVLGCRARGAVHVDGDVADQQVGAVCDQVKPLLVS
jgi:hypothetical protein